MSALAEPAAAAPMRRATIEFARTPDDWDLALHHYPGRRADLPPVILCSGYACNRHFVDFDEQYSLARFLVRRGFAAWVLELRGHGFSEPAGGRSRGGWTFDDLVRSDVPTAIAAVRARSGGRAPVWIGHSMGGMVVYAALGTIPALHTSLAGLVTLASPIAFPPVTSPTLRRLGRLFLALPLPARLPQRGAMVGLWGALGLLAPQAAEIGMNPANVDAKVFARALRQSICSVPPGLLRQLAAWALSGEFRSRDGIDYRAGLDRITVPLLVIAGACDQLAAPAMVRYAYEHAASTCKRYREFGTRSGESADYGHIDLIFGRRAPIEVFPAISTWIESELMGG